MDSVGLRYTLNTFYERYERPIFIVENGFSKVDDESKAVIQDNDRIEYLAACIREMKKAIELNGADIIGYTDWGCIDAVSFTTGEMKKIYVYKDDEECGILERRKNHSLGINE
ncbi:family 1 glycosylhydrolase [Enterococcus gallinarum]|nr:family 1 glycosylhydrolase [Enterococcus gallinarum]